MAIKLAYIDSESVTDNGWFGGVEAITLYTNNRALIETDATISGNAQAGDVVKLYNPNDPSDFCYGLVVAVGAPTTYTDAFSISYDDKVYTINTSSSYGYVIFESDTANGMQTMTNQALTYKIIPSIETAVYSEQYIRYSVKKRFAMEIDNYKRRYFDYIENFLIAKNMYVLDDCYPNGGSVYKVWLQDNSCELVNNAFKKSINFKIASS